VVRSFALLPSSFTAQCLEYFILVIKGAGKKWKRVVLTTKANISLSVRLLGTLRYISSIIFGYPENYDIRQTFGPGGAGYRRVYLCRENIRL
jgi:hypothetical protein